MGGRLRRRWRLPSPPQSVGLPITGLCFSASIQIVGGENRLQAGVLHRSLQGAISHERDPGLLQRGG
jgi:hypothetical protein